MRLLSILVFVLVSVSATCAQERRVTPVETDDKKPVQPQLHYYDKHGKPLDEPVLFLATLDTVSAKKVSPGPVYPRLSELNVGLNFFDGILALAGSDYGGASVWANVGLWNWLFPTVEIGIGTADKKPDGNNFHYKGKLAPYFKLGADYNFLYKSNPDYQLLAGLRVGFSSFKYSLEDVVLENGYWDETQTRNFDSLGSSAFYGEAGLGLKIRIARNFSMGWNVSYRFLFSNKATELKPGKNPAAPYGTEFKPWYIPGYGPRTSHLGFGFSAIYTFSVYKPVPKADEKQ